MLHFTAHMPTGLAITDYIVVGCFFAVMLGVGIVYARRMDTLSDFFSGSRRVPWWLAGTSLYMTTFSAFTFVSYSAIAYEYGFVAVTVWWFSIPGCLLSARFLASRWRRAAATSPLEYLETRFSPFLRQCFGWFGVPLIVLDDALKLFVIGSMLKVSLGFETSGWEIAIIVGCGLVMMLYTLLGGLWAVMITDCVQFIVMAAAVIVLAPLATAHAGGIANVIDALPDGHKALSAGAYSWPWLFSFAVVLALTYATKWPYVQRYYSARSDKEARRVGYLVGALTFIAPPLLFWPAMAGVSFLENVQDNNDVYPMLCNLLLPAGMMGIVIAAMFSATMSMLSSDYNSVASVVTNDIIKRIFIPEASERTLVFAGRMVTLVVGTIAIALAIMLARTEGLEDLVKIMARLFAVLLPPVALPMMAGLLSQRVSSVGAITGFFAGAISGISAYAASYGDGLAYLSTIPYLTWITIIPTAIGLGVGSLVRPDSDEKQANTRSFLEGLSHKEDERTEPQRGPDAALALRVIGVTCIALGVVLVLATLLTAGMIVVSVGTGFVLAAGGGFAVWLSTRSETIREV